VADGTEFEVRIKLYGVAFECSNGVVVGVRSRSHGQGAGCEGTGLGGTAE